MMVLRGGMNTVKQAKAIWIEVNSGNMYRGDSSVNEIIEVLSKDFSPLYINMNENKWGDAFFVNKELL